MTVRFDDIDPYRDCHRIGAAGRQTAAQVTGWQAALDEAWAGLARDHPERARSLSTGLAALVPLELAGQAASSASNSDACGLVALTAPADGRTLATALVHEYQHSKLSALLDLVPLHHAGRDPAHYAPWRPDPRPLGGLFQGVYAYLGLVDLWQSQRLAGSGPDSRLAQVEFARWLPTVRRVLHTLAGSGQLTGAGIRFVAGMRGRLGELAGHRTPPEYEALGQDARLDHWTCWRLYNLRPDADHAADHAAAWLAGRPCPRAWGRTVVLAGRRWSGQPERQGIMYRLVRDPDAGPGDGADAAYALGDYPTAARLYGARLAVDADAWAGLALSYRKLRAPGAGPLLARPEFARAVHDRIVAVRGEPVDVAALAGWLGGRT